MLFDPPSIVLAHVNVAPFVQHAARALHEHGMLARMLTTVADRPQALWQRFLCRVARMARFDLAREFRRRAVLEVPDRVVTARAWPELVRLGVSRLDRSGVWADRAHEWMETGFDQWVARTALGKADAVYGYENACADVFREATDRGLFCVYDAPAPEHRFSRTILDAELSHDATLDTAYQRHIHQPHLEARRDARRQSEYARADLIVTASSVTRNSFAEYFRARGRDAEVGKLAVVPYGAPPPIPEGADGGSAGSGPVRFLWAGSFSIRKGARYLLEAWRQLAPSAAAAVLDVHGTVTVPTALRAGIPGSVRFHGPVGREDLFRAYGAADLLLFPSLCDGFGMVVTEALSHGLPVLTTRRAGAADLVRPGENGFVIPAADASALANSLEWAMSHRAELAAMRPAALAAAGRWQWADYRQELARVVRDRYLTWRGER